MKVTTTEVASILGMSDRAVRKRAKKEEWPSVQGEKTRGGGKVYEIESLPADIQAKIWKKKPVSKLVTEHVEELLPTVSQAAVPMAKEDARVQGGTIIPVTFSQGDLEEASSKANLLRLYKRAVESAGWGKKQAAKDEFMLAYNSGIAWPTLYKELGQLTWKTLEGWESKVKKCGGDARRLADQRGRHRRGTCCLTDQQTEILLGCVLHPNKLRIAEAIRVAGAVMNKKGIKNSQSDATYRRWLQDWKEHNYHVWTFLREGKKAWNDKCAYYIERDINILDVGDVIVADGHNLNFEIINPWTGKVQNHMTLILFYDMKSNMPLGWEIMPTENTSAISSALRRAVIRLGKYPRVVYLDNGRAFKSRFFKGSPDFEENGYGGLYERMGCQTIYAWPYHGQSKTVERFFGTFAELERLNALSYTGTSIENKPPRMMRGEKMHRSLHEKQFGGRCLSMAEAHQIIAAWFDAYATREQGPNSHLKGICPAEVFEEGRGPGVNRAELTWLMMSMEIKHIHRNGITFQGQNYYHPILTGRKHPVVVRYDLQDTSSLWLFEGDEFLCEATPTALQHPAAAQLGTEEDKEALRQHIEYKRHQEKEVSGTARALLSDVVLPEHERQMRFLGMSEQADGTSTKALQDRPAKVVRFDEKKVAREVEEQQRWQQEAEARDFRDSLLCLSEADRYERLIELDAQGIELAAEWTGFMSFYEQTPEYERFADYWESCRVKYGLMYRSAERADRA